MKVLKNYAYNLSYQLLVIILPIITTPYVTRVFSSDDLGTYGYFNSIVTYFILLATLGVANYGTVHLTVYYAKFLSKNFDLIAHSEVKWIDPAEVSKLTWAPADIPAAKVISKTNLNGVKFDAVD